LLESVKQAKIGNIVPVYKEIDEEINALEYFAKLSDYGKKKNSIFLENNEKSFGTVNPCLKVTGKGIDFEITALNALGKKFLDFIKKDFKFCDKAVYSKGKIIGKLTPAKRDVSEQEKLKLKTHFDIIRKIAFKFKPTAKLLQYCGLVGIISYDFANQDDEREDLLKDPDYILYFVDNMFIVNHKTKKTYFVANALITDKSNEKTYTECNKTINSYEKLISKKALKGKKPKKKQLKLSYDMNNEEFLGAMKSLKKHILNSSILYGSPSRTTITTYNAEPLDVFAQLNNTFFINDGLGVTIGSEAKANLTVNSEIVELEISATARPRGKVKDEIEKDIDNKYEALLKVDENDIAHNIMIVDAARNDVARISKLGTRYVDKMLVVNKQDESQNLTSNIKGTLNENLDALHAYMEVINPAVTNGVPKEKSVQLLGKTEKGKRGFCSGSFLCVTPNKDLQSIATEPIRIKKDKAYLRTSCRIFHNSNDNDEFKASNKKAIKLLDALRSGGIK
jgi:anthranilate synthase component 1|tara:strand:+ start:7707 stop:9230 length:1524 start_codon:yes stop_codon:yes gene_type:complete